MEKNKNLILQKVNLVCRKTLWIVGIFGFFTNLLMLTVPIYMMQIYDRVLASHSHETLFYLTLLAIIATLVLVTVDHARSKILIYLSAWIDREMSVVALESLPDEILQGRSYAFQAQRDITQLRQIIASPTTFSIMDWPFVPIYLLVIFLLHPMLGFLSLIGSLLLFSFALLNEKLTHHLLLKANMRASHSEEAMLGALRNAEVIQALGMMPNLLKRWEISHEPVLEMQVIASEKSGVILGLTKFVRIVLQILLLGIGAYYVLANQLTAGGMIAASILASRALAPVEQSISIWKQLISGWQSYQRLQTHFYKSIVRTLGIQLPTPLGEIRVENVSLRVPHVDKFILQDISFTITPGELIALIGPSGSGKSSLIRLIVGALKPTVGVIRLDSADVFEWDREDFGRHVGYVPQDVQLFEGTVKDNIARLGVVNDQAVIKAAQIAGMHEIILHLPMGYNTELKMSGMQLSAGQKQRIALARALYQEPKVLLYDEPNAHLDQTGDLHLKHVLTQMKSQKVTQIIITHRPSVVEDADRIIVLNEGKLQMIGPKQAVFAQFKATVPT